MTYYKNKPSSIVSKKANALI